MIVFWKQYHSRAAAYCSNYDWRCYKGRARLRNGFLHIYPCNGQRRKLSEYIAFDDKVQPPRIVSTNQSTTQGVEVLPLIGEIAEHIPELYTDKFQNIRRIDKQLSLVLMGPEWSDQKEAEFQDIISIPF